LSKPQLQTSIITITPALATQWLEDMNIHNRALRQGAVERYAADMKAGKWRLNGESIVISKPDTKGQRRILDGQHRLWASVEADSTFKAVVVEGVDEDHFATIDTGAARSIGDVLKIAGVGGHKSTVGAAATAILQYLRGDSLGNPKPVTKQDALDYVQANEEDLARWVEQVRSGKTWTNAYAANVVAVLFLGAHKHPQKALQFAHAFSTGENLTVGSPIMALRNRLAVDKRMGKWHRMALIVMAWNAFVANKNLHKMQSPRSDTFPKIAGAPA
jgi:hypothetical protein